MNILLCFAMATILGGLGYCLLRRRPALPEIFLLVRCPPCGQKVRYAAHNAGGTGMCPRCFKQLALPKTPQPLCRPQRPYRIGERLAC